MRLIDFLKTEAHVGDVVIFREHGWQIGMTRIDNEGLYEYSLNPSLLYQFNVVQSAYDHCDWIDANTLVVDISMDCGVNDNEHLQIMV